MELIDVLFYICCAFFIIYIIFSMNYLRESRKSLAEFDRYCRKRILAFATPEISDADMFTIYIALKKGDVEYAMRIAERYCSEKDLEDPPESDREDMQ